MNHDCGSKAEPQTRTSFWQCVSIVMFQLSRTSAQKGYGFRPRLRATGILTSRKQKYKGLSLSAERSLEMARFQQFMFV